MDKNDIEARLRTGEFRNLDFKKAHRLDDASKIKITKDLIAFSNIADGGLIIIGVDEKKADITDPKGEHYEITGMEPEILATWVRDELAATANKYADPYVDFSFEIVPLDERKSCLVIKVFEFENCPVLCKKDANGLRHGALYTRPRGGKRESCEVRSQTEVREILEMATEKNLRKFIGTAMKIGMPLTLDPSEFDKQLEGFLTSDDAKEKFKSKGYWEIVIRPSKFIEKRIPSLRDCVDIIRDNNVLFRGWDYPHYDSSNGPIPGGDYMEQSFCWEEYGHIEIWRYYQSGQFAHYLAVWEDWDRGIKDRGNNRDPKVLNLISTIYLLTEIFEFAARLGTKGYLGDSCEIKITLHDAKDRSLISPVGFLSPNYVSNLPEISYSVILSVSDLIGNADDHALTAAKYLFERFNWLSFSGEGFKSHQKKLRAKEW